MDFWRKPERKRELKLDLTADQFESNDPRQDRGPEGHARERLRQQDQLFSATCDPHRGGVFDHLLDPELQFIHRETSTNLKAELRKLPPNQRKVLDLIYFRGLPQKQIAQILGLSPGTVNSHLTRGLRNLSRALAAQGREIEAHLWRLERAFRGGWMIRPAKPPAVLAPPLTRHSAGFGSRGGGFHHLHVVHHSGARQPGLECPLDCAACERLRSRSRSEDARRSGEYQAIPTAPPRILSPGWVSAPVPDDREDIALLRKIQAALALVREWFPRCFYPTACQIQQEWEKQVLDLERTLARILAEVWNAARVSSCCTSEDWEEWNEWKQQVLGWKERELEWERIRATTVRDVRRAWWQERELRDVAYILNTDDVPARFGNKWHYTGVRLFLQRNAAAAVRRRMKRAARLPRIARVAALTIRLEQLLRNGTVNECADLAHLGRAWRARITQIVNLLNLAP